MSCTYNTVLSHSNIECSLWPACCLLTIDETRCIYQPRFVRETTLSASLRCRMLKMYRNVGWNLHRTLNSGMCCGLLHSGSGTVTFVGYINHWFSIKWYSYPSYMDTKGLWNVEIFFLKGMFRIRKWGLLFSRHSATLGLSLVLQLIFIH